MSDREPADARSASVSVHRDERGVLTTLDLASLPFEVGRVFVVHDVPHGAKRGGHGHRAQDELLVVISGRGRSTLRDGSGARVVELGAGDAQHIPPGSWHEIEALERLVVLVAAAGSYDRDDYFQDPPASASEAPTASQTTSS